MNNGLLIHRDFLAAVGVLCPWQILCVLEVFAFETAEKQGV